MTKEKILKVSAEEFAKYGYDGLSMNALAKTLGINKATIYYHFADKRTLYKSVIIELIEGNQAKVDALLLKPMPPREKFKAYIATLVLSMEQNPEIIQIILREMANFGSNIDESISEYLEKDIQTLTTLLQNLNLKKRYENSDPHIIKSLILGTINSYYCMQQSRIELKSIHSFDESNALFNYIENFIGDLLLDALYEC